MTGDQDPNNPDEYLRKLQDAAQTPETTTPTNYGQQPGNQPPQYQQTHHRRWAGPSTPKNSVAALTAATWMLVSTRRFVRT